MNFCTNCGSQLIPNAKFCAACGTNVRLVKKSDNSLDEFSKSDTSQKKVPKPLKGKVNNLFKEKTQSFLDKENPIKSATTIENTPTIHSHKEISKKVNKWMLYYFLINIPLYFINTGDDEILGVLIFSSAVLVGYVIYSFQKKKEKPYTIGLKIILLLQGILAVSGIMQRLEFIASAYSLIAVVCLALLVFLNIKIIFRRNK